MIACGAFILYSPWIRSARAEARANKAVKAILEEMGGAPVTTARQKIQLQDTSPIMCCGVHSQFLQPCATACLSALRATVTGDCSGDAE